MGVPVVDACGKQQSEESECAIKIVIDAKAYKDKCRGGRKKRFGGMFQYYKKRISLYKTEICKTFETSNFCPYGVKCQFAHSLEELREVERHPRYKTELCRTYTLHGECPYGRKCCFVHAGSSESVDSDSQDARNPPGDWKVPSAEVPDVVMRSIEEDEAKSGCSSGSFLTKEEVQRILSLSFYKGKLLSSIHQRISKLSKYSALSPGRSITCMQSSSLTWTKDAHSFLYVGTGSRITSVKSLGKAPGLIYFTTR